MRKHCTAIVLSAGQGKRMGGKVQKQYMELKGRPVLWYSLAAFGRSPLIDDIVLVVGAGQEDYVRTEIVGKYHITKVCAVVRGGKERYDSVWRGLQALPCTEDGYVFIHDGARPFLDEGMLERGFRAARECGACVAGMPSKDTVKLAGEGGYIRETPKREQVWIVQTPQIFGIPLILKAYTKFMEEKTAEVTDDAMVVEQMLGVPVKLFEGSYRNIKITTPEDMTIAEALGTGYFSP